MLCLCLFERYIFKLHSIILSASTLPPYRELLFRCFSPARATIPLVNILVNTELKSSAFKHLPKNSSQMFGGKDFTKKIF